MTMVVATDGSNWADLVTQMVAEKRRAMRRLARAAGLPDPAMRDERARLDSILDDARAPERCGPEIIPAPGRGPMLAFAPIGMVPQGRDGWRVDHVGYRGRDAARRADVFDVMEDQARRRARDGQAAAALFSPGQIQMARFYRTMTERHDAGGVRCVSLEALRQPGGGRGGEFIDAFVDEGRRLAAIHRRIGAGVAMAVRRVRSSMRGGAGASIITDRQLVDAVCLHDMTLGAVLRAHGWSNDSKHRAALRAALCAALDRMQGYLEKGA